ncbi:MAG TPA: lamin tail domain-containing protein, partial [Pyrinomonadaceae bacterium]|nr:lamin tail domain-containing protein [Pyrinomonadaceae bacterium]
ALDFTTPNTATTGAKDGNAAANRTTLTSTITGLSIAPGATLWIRWTDPDAAGSDDGLAVDDFSLKAGINTPALSISDVTQSEGNAGTTTFNFTISLTSAAGPGGVNFTINTADGTTDPATAGSDYVAVVNGSGSIAPGNTSTTVSVTVNGDTTVEPDETFFVNLMDVTGATVSDGQGLGTITNDDAVAASSDLSLTETVNNSTPNIGERVTFTIALNNAGPSAATGVQVMDLLPAGLQFVSSNPSQGTYSSGTGVWSVGTVNVASPAATLTITATVLTTGTKTSRAEVTASGVTDPDSTPNDRTGDDFASATVTGASNLVINEVHTQAQASPPANANDFVELFNKSTQAIDISGLVLSYRAGATTPNTFTLPALTVIPAGGYLIIVNGATTYGVTADINAASAGFNLTATSGGVQIALNGVKLDGLAYQTPGNNVSATFLALGEGTAFTSPTASGQQDYVRSPNGADSNDNATDFRRSGTNSSTVTPKASNPTITP